MPGGPDPASSSPQPPGSEPGGQAASGDVDGELERRRRRRRWRRSVLALLAVAVVVAAVLRVPAAVRDFTSAFTHIRPARLPWLAIAVGAEAVSFVFFAALQGVLLLAGHSRVRMRVLLRLSIASSGLRALLPVGVVPSSGWLLSEYRRIGVAAPLALYVVLASGYVSTVTILGLLLLGSVIAGFGAAPVLAASAVVLTLGSVGFVALVHRFGALHRLERASRGPLAPLARKAVEVADEVGHLRVGGRGGTIAFASAAGNWLADLVCLISAFALLGEAVPWRGVLFAYAVSQVAGSLVPLPGGLGAVEGGIVGSLDLLGVSVGAALAVAITYRVITYWGVAVLGGVELAILSRHPPGPEDLEDTSTPTSGPSAER